jgi:hypothetical protein
MDGTSEFELIAEIEQRQRRLEGAREQLAHSEAPEHHEHLERLEQELKEAIERLHHVRGHGSDRAA